MKLLSTFIAVLSVSIVSVSAFAQAPPKSPRQVRVHLLEALAPRDTTSSETFRKEFESSVELAKKLTSGDLSRCGYSLETELHLYDANDSLQAHDQAVNAEKKGAWLIVGPRRSNHYLLVAKGAPNTPSVSIMASSSEVEQLGATHLSVYPFNNALAKAAAEVTRDLALKGKAKTYFSVVSGDCVACKDFSSKFDEFAAKFGFAKQGQVMVAGENPDPSPIVEEIVKAKPQFVLLPNYSKVSALMMGAIHSKLPEVRFIGGDGWGDQKFGFIERNPAVKQAPGVTVRGFPPAGIGLKQFSLGRKALAQKDPTRFIPSSGPGMAILRVFQGLADSLCADRPKDSAGFKTSFVKSGRARFSSPWGISAYRVSNGQVNYWRTVKSGK